jgi:hypothetical protein
MGSAEDASGRDALIVVPAPFCTPALPQIVNEFACVDDGEAHRRQRPSSRAVTRLTSDNKYGRSIVEKSNICNLNIHLLVQSPD